jgi:hypothetical protein
MKIELDWNTEESLPDPPPLQAWVEITSFSDKRRSFMLVPHSPLPIEQQPDLPPWTCPVHGPQRVVSCANEGYVCTEDVSGRGPEDTTPYIPCGLVCSGPR